jgi:hypothetical protein
MARFRLRLIEVLEAAVGDGLLKQTKDVASGLTFSDQAEHRIERREGAIDDIRGPFTSSHQTRR